MTATNEMVNYVEPVLDQQQEVSDHAKAQHVTFELDLIEAAFRTLQRKTGSISGIRICLPRAAEQRTDIGLNRIVDRWGAEFSLDGGVDHRGDLIVVSVGRHTDT